MDLKWGMGNQLKLNIYIYYIPLDEWGAGYL